MVKGGTTRISEKTVPLVMEIVGEGWGGGGGKGRRQEWLNDSSKY